MRRLKTVVMVAALVLTGLLSLAGCGEDHGDHFRGDRDDRHPARYDSDGHGDHGGNSGHEQGQHSDR